MPRNMTDPEKDTFQEYFPPMDLDLQPRVTGEATEAYNCIAWTVGITNAWINPFQDVDDWDAFYAPYNLVRHNAAGTVAIWRNGPEYTHGCIANALEGFHWESKCGPDLRILHELDELIGMREDDYGQVEFYYRAAGGVGAPQSFPSFPAASGSFPNMTNLQEQTAQLQKLTSNVPAPLRETFETLFATWKGTWFAGTLARDSDTRARARGYAFKKLVDMGPSILPLVHEKMLDPKNFIAIELQDAIEPDKAGRPRIAASDPAIREGVQGRARRATALYLSRQK